MIPFEKLNLNDGHLIVGRQLSDHCFLGSVKAAQLFQIAPNPLESEDLRKVQNSKTLQEIAEIRNEVQRLFGGSKKRNVESYSEYILSLRDGGDGITPPIMLYSEKSLDTAVEAQYQLGGMLVPYGQVLVAIDGETQLAARYMAAEADPATRGDSVAVIIVHGRTKDWARQAFHDLNVLGIRPNAAISIGMDNRDALTQIARHVEQRVPFFRGRVNTVRRQLKPSDTDVVTITGLRGTCVTFAEGIAGVKYGTRPVPMHEDRVPMVQARAVEWFTAVTAALGAAMESREDKLASGPSVLAAIGAVGNRVLNIDDEIERRQEISRLVGTLRSVNWSRGSQWDGIAGKTNPKGVLSIGGSKETAYAIYSALADETSPGYPRIRMNVVQLASAANS
jgi:hypothetical protein